MTTDLVAFIDESKKPVRDLNTGKVSGSGDYYVVASAVVLDGDMDYQRAELNRLQTKLGFDLHYGDMKSDTRRRQAVDGIAAIENWDAYVFETESPIRAGGGAEHYARARLLRQAFSYLEGQAGVSRAVLETRDTPTKGLFDLNAKDHLVLRKLNDKAEVSRRFSIDHHDKSELILAIADIVAGTRTDWLCWKNREFYPLLGHRVTVRPCP